METKTKQAQLPWRAVPSAAKVIDPELRSVLEALAENQNTIMANWGSRKNQNSKTITGNKSITVDEDNRIGLVGDKASLRGDQYYGTRDGRLGFHDLVLPSFIDYAGADSVEVTRDQIRLLHDDLVPGPHMYYGTGTRGIKAWLPFGGAKFQAKLSMTASGPITILSDPSYYVCDTTHFTLADNTITFLKAKYYAVLLYMAISYTTAVSPGYNDPQDITIAPVGLEPGKDTISTDVRTYFDVTIPMTFIMDTDWLLAAKTLSFFASWGAGTGTTSGLGNVTIYAI